MFKLAVITILLVESSLGSPVPQTDESDKEESGSQAIFSLFSQLAGVVQKTGDVISQLSKNYTDLPELSLAGEKISEAGESAPDDFNDIVQDNFQKLLKLLPGIKHNITEAMNQLPGIREKISENIAKLPSSDTIKENVESILDFLPEHQIVDDIRSTFEEHVDKIPSADYIDSNIQMALDNIPSADYVNSKVDEFVDQ